MSDSRSEAVVVRDGRRMGGHFKRGDSVIAYLGDDTTVTGRVEDWNGDIVTVRMENGAIGGFRNNDVWLDL